MKLGELIMVVLLGSDNHYLQDCSTQMRALHAPTLTSKTWLLHKNVQMQWRTLHCSMKTLDICGKDLGLVMLKGAIYITLDKCILTHIPPVARIPTPSAFVGEVIDTFDYTGYVLNANLNLDPNITKYFVKTCRFNGDSYWGNWCTRHNMYWNWVRLWPWMYDNGLQRMYPWMYS